ncbi:hypothetical protein CP02DC21_2187, partial [Chlamydia psittaci 02DC21]
CTGQIRFVAQF